ncbi:two-component sensor histidine kinase [Paenibacillus sp. VTT E-133280]|uniref:sensor histidine kinase n=1 Tax=unclassified Paenibacillus TaxID=185978 RepID=UPI000BA15221|nr:MULTISPECIES: HAMP domain-containing sensor histidine kinase [unclassified Paenibacillus]MBY3621383.1 HAMP domain-containing histidine kinase [Acinetobacter sp. CUI P1]MDH6373006.1 signal transduction histidine kinase [Paenibacillus sp. PastF-3]OZQ60342.1 two-component sensor histidine kinase [Paenibacillus sp. VTT E-133280]OZQ85091.1 two-component sensor histidine kinase [Paenibacillus sp. VTT E-133291]
MRNNRIGLKLGLVIITVLLIVLLFLGFAIDKMFTNFYTAEMRKETEEIASHFSVMANAADTTSEQTMMTFAEFSNVSIFNILENGKVNLHSGVHDSADRAFIRNSDLEKIFTGKKVSLLYEDPDGHRYFVSGQPISSEGVITSALYVMSSTEQMEQSLSGVRNLLILSGMGAFLLALGITWIIAQVLSRPLLQMQKATRKIAIGELETRIEIKSRDEIGSLAEAINDLAADLQRYRDTRQELFSNISHDLRTPITYLEGYSKVVRDHLYETEEEKERYLDIIYQEAVRLQHLVDDVFDLAKMEEGKIPLLLERINMTDLVEQAVQKVELKRKEKSLSLSFHPYGTSSLVLADGKRMEQIVLNLLENAVRYTEKGSINVDLQYTTTSVILIVEDTGIGIPEEDLPYIFERFYRVEKSRSRQFGGTGLGLSIVKKLIELQGGEITVTSKLGEGTRFEVHFMLQPSHGGESCEEN